MHEFSLKIPTTFYVRARYNVRMISVVIYSKPGCHLCDEAKAAIQASGCDGQFRLEEINIESDSELLRRYRYEIPVITIDGVEAFRYRLGVEEFKAAINRLSH